MYRFPTKALKTWANRSLELLETDGRIRRYRFRLTGSTCNNGGGEFDLDFYLELDTEPADPVVTRAWSDIPADSLEAAGAMCAAGGDARGHLDSASVTAAAPQIGNSLSSLIGYDRALNPAGCICYRDMTAHKWLMVAETVHRAIAEESAASSNAIGTV